MPIPEKNKFREIALLSIRTCPYRSEQEKFYAAALINSVFTESEQANERPLLILLEALLKHPVLNDSSLSDEERDLELGMIDVEKQQMMHASPLELLKWHTQFQLRRAHDSDTASPELRNTLSNILLTQQLLLECISVCFYPHSTPKNASRECQI
ncbi:MAG: hypothetical protein IJB00_06995 [Akkermansia sp.]|nr:hypothetical protein [Akkermansia sp.]